MEAGTRSIWISERLQELGHEVIVANVRELRAISHSDRNSPTSSVLGQVPTGVPTAYKAFTQTNTFGGATASLKLITQPIVLGLASGSRTDALNLEINLTNLPELPADTYTGTLTIQAQQL